jgi:prophage DNA circulation protein
MATGCYVARYLPASFNGIPFEAVDADSEHGRRGAEGEFPFGETTAYADLGRKIRRYNISGRLQENNHVELAAALILACEAPGPGILVHPTRGIINAACVSLKVSDRVEEEQGVTYVDMQFVEGNAWPNGFSIGASIVALAFTALVSAATNRFRNDYVIADVSTHRKPQVRQLARSTVATIRDEYQTAIGNTRDIDRWRAYSDLDSVAESFTAVNDTDTTEETIRLGINAVANQLSAKERFTIMRRIANSVAVPVTLTGAAGRAQNAVIRHTRVLAAMQMAQAAVSIKYATNAEAFDALDRITALLTNEAEIAQGECANELFMELRTYANDTQTNLYNVAYNLPATRSFDFHGSVHPLVAAYSIYNDAKRHRELEDSNILTHVGKIGSDVIASV